MRFYEFYPTTQKVYKLTEKWLRELDIERMNSIREGTVILDDLDTEAINEYKNFIGRYLTDPNNLVKDEKYFAVSFQARPLAKSLKLEYSLNPFVYLNKTDNNFIFQNINGINFHVPINYTIDDQDFGICFFSTTVFTKETELEHFLLILKLQFDKRWKISEEIRE